MTEDAVNPPEASMALQTGAAGDSAETLCQVFDAARRFISCRERAAAVAMGRIPPARTLAEAIERDFLAFDLEDAERALREAVINADPLFALLLAAESNGLAGAERENAGRTAPL
jgi:hypothetical protein